MANCSDYISADDLKTGKQAVLHIEHVAKSKDANGQPALEVTDTIRGESVTNPTLDGFFSSVGFKPADGSFDVGGEIQHRWETLLYEAEGSYYQWMGALPKVVPAGSTPATTGGVDATHWVNQTDLTLRADLASSALGKGDELLRVKSSIPGAVARTQHDKNSEHITPQDFGARGDSVTDDTAVFALIDAAMSDQEIDLMGKTYFVFSIPTGNRYFNGSWQLPAGPARGRWQGTQLTGAGRIVFGDGALAALPIDYEVGEFGVVLALGAGAMGKMTQVKKAIAIGPNSQGDGTCSRDNISIGEDSLRFVQSRTPDYDQSQQQGTRNIAFGGNAGRFIVEGSHNVITGRNAGQCIVNGTHSAIYGSNAAGGYAPVGLSGVIENWAPNNGPDGVSAFGDAALNRITTGFNSAFGQNTLSSLVIGRGNSAFGIAAMNSAESNLAFNGGVLTTLNINGTYSHAGNVLTINAVAHGASVGDIVGIRLLDGGSQTFQGDVCPAYVTTVINANSFTVAHPVSRTATGNSTLYWRTTAAAGPKSEFNTAFGGNAAGAMIRGSENSVFGYGVMINANDAAADTSRNTAFGFRALSGWTSPQMMTAVGHDALRFMQDGSVATGAGSNCTGIGRSSRVSGNNQVQLGDASTTTYVYGTVQNRSDERDKADLRPTTLEDDFIDGLEAEEGFWDMRDDYVQFCPDAPEAPIMPKAPVHPSERKVTLAGKDSQGIRVYHLDGDPTNPYSRVVETDSTWSGNQQSDGASFDYHVQLAAYQEEYAAYEIKLAQYPNDVVKYENDLVIWEAECERIKQHNARVATGEGRDGSKKRNRLHQWFSFQKVRALCERIGKDFGGMQDHSINGGCDVGTLGYDEFIPPMTAYMQRRKTEILELQKVVAEQAMTISALEDRLAKVEEILAGKNI